MIRSRFDETNQIETECFDCLHCDETNPKQIGMIRSRFDERIEAECFDCLLQSKSEWFVRVLMNE